VIETVEARADLRHAPRGLGGWSSYRSPKGITTYSHPSPPPGVTSCRYVRTLDGVHRGRIEGNLTALRFGPSKTCYSLRPADLPAARDALLDAAANLLGDVCPDAAAWDVHRFDPSATYRLPDDVLPSELVIAAHAAFRVMAEPRHVVSLHNDQTATWIRAKWRSVMVYDKGAESRRRGVVPDAANLLRIEQRIRPRRATGEWAEMNKSTLAEIDALATKSMAENLELLSDLGVRMAAAQSLTLIRALLRGGASPNAALRLAMAVELERSYGSRSLEAVGLAESTAHRWRSDIKRYLAASGGMDAATADLSEVLATMVPTFADEHEVTVTRKGKP
jgi:hypothetical protein